MNPRRAVSCYWARRKLGAKVVELTRELGQTPPSIPAAVQRGERLAKEKGYLFDQNVII